MPCERCSHAPYVPNCGTVEEAWKYYLRTSIFIRLVCANSWYGLFTMFILVNHSHRQALVAKTWQFAYFLCNHAVSIGWTPAVEQALPLPIFDQDCCAGVSQAMNWFLWHCTRFMSPESCTKQTPTYIWVKVKQTCMQAFIPSTLLIFKFSPIIVHCSYLHRACHFMIGLLKFTMSYSFISCPLASIQECLHVYITCTSSWSSRYPACARAIAPICSLFLPSFFAMKTYPVTCALLLFFFFSVLGLAKIHPILAMHISW